MSKLAGVPELRLRRASFVVTPVTLADLLAGLVATPGARAVPDVGPLRDGVVLAGVEVAGTNLTDDRMMRKAWRDRRGGGPTPLLLLADDPGRAGRVRALGVLDPADPIRMVDVTALAAALARVASLPRLEAVRELAAELDRLDQAGIPGLKLRELLTLHTLNVRLRDDAVRWADLQEAVKAVPRAMDWRTLLTTLGYEVIARPLRGRLLRFDGRPVAVVHPKADPAAFSRLADDGRPAEGMLLNDCATEGASYGLLASGTRLRLFDATPATGSAAARYLDLDTAVLQDDDRPFLGLLGPAYLAAGRFAALQREARDYGAGLRTRLDQAIRQHALPPLGFALGRWARANGADPADDATREELERAALTLVFRGLFILYAEAAGYLPMGSRAYEESSLTRLVEEAADGMDDLEAHLERVRGRAATDPAGAADELFDFAVLDPACGSAHFLVVVVAELADLVVRFLGETPLPAVGASIERLRAGASVGAAIDDVALLRRLVTKRCVFGVDLSPMGAEVAKLSLWLASFVPGLSLAYLDRNVQVGNSLVGVVQPGEIIEDSALFQGPLRQATEEAVAAVRQVAAGDDRSPD